MSRRGPQRGASHKDARTRNSEVTSSFTYVYPDRLRSCYEGLFFDALVRVAWRRRLADATTASPRLAADLVRRVVDPAAQTMSVLRIPAAEHHLTAVLAAAFPRTFDGIEVVGVEVELSVDEETERSARRVERQLHEMELDELARRQAKARADFLRSEVLRDPATAQVYALVDMPNAPSRLGNIDQAEHLFDKVRWWAPGSQWITTAQLLHTFVERLTETQKRDLLIVLRKGLVALGDQDEVALFDKLHDLRPSPSDPLQPSSRHPTTAQWTDPGASQ